MGFAATLDAILSNLPTERQTLLFSATQTKSIKTLARLSLSDPQVSGKECGNWWLVCPNLALPQMRLSLIPAPPPSSLCRPACSTWLCTQKRRLLPRSSWIRLMRLLLSR